jgi:hypothetical protein
MLLRLEMPMINPSLRGGKVLTWHVDEGEQIGFGEDICTVSLDDFVQVRRTGRATQLAGKKMGRLKSNLESRSGEGLVNVVITASDRGRLARILKAEGESVVIGDLVAVVSTDDSDNVSTPDSWVEAPVMRVVGNISSEMEDI